MIAFLVRRFISKDRRLRQANDNVLLHPQVARGRIQRDPAYGFILIYVGSRF